MRGDSWDEEVEEEFRLRFDHTELTFRLSTPYRSTMRRSQARPLRADARRNREAILQGRQGGLRQPRATAPRWTTSPAGRRSAWAPSTATSPPRRRCSTPWSRDRFEQIASFARRALERSPTRGRGFEPRRCGAEPSCGVRRPRAQPAVRRRSRGSAHAPCRAGELAPAASRWSPAPQAAGALREDFRAARRPDDHVRRARPRAHARSAGRRHWQRAPAS